MRGNRRPLHMEVVSLPSRQGTCAWAVPRLEGPMATRTKPAPGGTNGATAGDRRTRAVTVPDFLAAKARGVRLTVLTAYDYTMARLLDAAGVDGILVGDSLGMVVQGHEHSLGVTL